MRGENVIRQPLSAIIMCPIVCYKILLDLSQPLGFAASVCNDSIGVEFIKVINLSTRFQCSICAFKYGTTGSDFVR